MHVNDLTRQIVDAAIKVHTALGPGLLESAYEDCKLIDLYQRVIKAESQVPRPIIYESVELDVGDRLDLVVDDLVIVEIKAVTEMNPLFEAQLLSYLKPGKRPVGLLINSHSVQLKDGIKRLVNRLPE